MKNPIKMDDLGVPLFLETPKCYPKWWFFMVMNPSTIRKENTIKQIQGILFQHPTLSKQIL